MNLMSCTDNSLPFLMMDLPFRLIITIMAVPITDPPQKHIKSRVEWRWEDGNE